MKIFEIILKNFLLNIFMLLGVKNILKIKGQYIFVMSIIFSCFQIFLPCFHLQTGFMLAEKFLSAVFLTCMCFRFKTLKSFLKVISIMGVSKLMFYGVDFFVMQNFGRLSLVVFGALVVCVYLFVLCVFKFLWRRKRVLNFCVDVKLEYNGKAISCRGFIDTGNLLVDPATNSSVYFVSLKILSELCGVSFADLLSGKNLKSMHYISVGTVGKGERLLAFEIDKLKVGSETIENPTLALSSQNFSDFDIILNNSFCLEGV